MIILRVDREISEYCEYYPRTDNKIVGVFNSISLVESAIKKYLSDNGFEWSEHHESYYRRTGEFKKDYLLVGFSIANIRINEPIGNNFEAFKRYEYKE